MQKRIEYLDFAKGIGIILVILGHAISPRPAFIYSFHMPLFLFISGYVFRVRPMKEMVVSKFNRLYIPYAFFYVVTWMIATIAHLYNGQGDKIGEDLIVLSKVLIGYEGNGGNVPIWFLVALFMICIMYNAICLVIKNAYVQSAIIIAITIAGNYMYWHDIELPYQLDGSFSAIMFFHVGYLMRNITPEIILEKVNKFAIVGVLILLFVIQVITCKLNLEYANISYVNVFVNKVGNYFWYYIPGICGTLWFLAICYMINFSKIINFYGTNSMVIMGFHNILIYTLLRAFGGKHGAPLYMEVAVSFVVLLLCTGLIFLCKKYVPRLTGYKPVIVLTGKN